MKYLNKYNNIMARYRAGEFGNETLTVHDILERANAADIVEKLTLSEINSLLNSSFGVIRILYSHLRSQNIARAISMDSLEKELAEYHIDSYRSSNDPSDKALADNLRLFVQYCDKELPSDTEAMLCPAEDNVHVGTIKIQKDCATSNFSFRHEIIHYFRDVKVGNRVVTEFTRKIKGKTPNVEEQEVNYLTAASIMPIGEISTKLDIFENATTEESERELLRDLAKQYEQDEDAVLRRLIEVRSLVDYTRNVKA